MDIFEGYKLHELKRLGYEPGGSPAVSRGELTEEEFFRSIRLANSPGFDFGKDYQAVGLFDNEDLTNVVPLRRI